MYESPITIYVDNMVSQLEQQRENDIMMKITEYTKLDINKDELVKALTYDREQYEKGKKDGKAEMIEKIEHAGPYTVGEIVGAMENAQELLQQQKLERPIIICHKEDEGIFKSYCPGANIIVMPEVLGKGLFIVDKELRREINQW